MKHRTYLAQLLAAGIGVTLPLLAMAQTEPIGYVKTVTGEAWVSSAGQRVRAGCVH